MGYDNNGNLTNESPFTGAGTVYTYDAWNRLVSVKVGGSTRSLYRYFPNHHRAQWFADTDFTGQGQDALDHAREYYYSSSWQVLDETLHNQLFGLSPGPTSVIRQYHWGGRGQDDLVATREVDTIAPSYDQYWVQVRLDYLTDPMLSPVAISSDGVLQERLHYSPYGAPILDPVQGDLDGDGSVGAGDLSALLAAWGPCASACLADLDGDGSVGSSDMSILLSSYWTPPAAGTLSQHGSIVGYAGYLYDPYAQLYLARHRHYSPELGRWFQRDPAGYMDGMSLYLYASSSPFAFVDPMGLAPTDEAMWYQENLSKPWPKATGPTAGSLLIPTLAEQTGWDEVRGDSLFSGRSSLRDNICDFLGAFPALYNSVLDNIVARGHARATNLAGVGGEPTYGEILQSTAVVAMGFDGAQDLAFGIDDVPRNIDTMEELNGLEIAERGVGMVGAVAENAAPAAKALKPLSQAADAMTDATKALSRAQANVGGGGAPGGIPSSGALPVPASAGNTPGPTGKIRSVAIEIDLDPSSYPGQSRRSHFKESNEKAPGES